MQIQRLQTLWLIIAALFAMISLCFPWLKIDSGYVTVQTDMPLLVIGILAAALPLIGIFMFRNLRLQKRICSLSSLMALFSIVYIILLSYLGPYHEGEICIWAPVCMVVSAILDIAARRGIIHDEKLLRSADRIR